MVVMGLSTTLIGVLPGYATAGALAPWLLCLLRFGQGVGLGGEWGGAALLATENAPHGQRAWFGMFPQLGPPIGFPDRQRPVPAADRSAWANRSFVAWAWRVPFLLSAALVAIGLYVRRDRRRDARLPRAGRTAPARCRSRSSKRSAHHRRPLIQGSLAIVVCYALFYVSTVFALGYGVTTLHHRAHRLPGDAVRGGAVHGGGDADLRRARRPLRPPAGAARRGDRRPAVGLAMPTCSAPGRSGVLAFLSLALARWASPLRRLARCCRSCSRPACATPAPSSAYNLGGILGASLAPYRRAAAAGARRRRLGRLLHRRAAAVSFLACSPSGKRATPRRRDGAAAVCGYAATRRTSPAGPRSGSAADASRRA